MAKGNENTMKKIFDVLKDIFCRKYPWKAHFFCETLELDDIFSMFKSFFGFGKDYIVDFQEEFKKTIDPGGKAFAFGSGRMALYAILEAMEIGEGDEVILPAFTCEVVVLALLYRKIVPVYTDIDVNNFNIDTGKLEKLVTPRTKAIIAQHTFGVPCNLDNIISISRKYGFYVIEDCALALGSTYKGKPVGMFGDASLFSMDRTKMITTMWGGVAFSSNHQMADKIEAVYMRSEYLPKRYVFNIILQMILSYFLFSPFTYYAGRYMMAAGYASGLLFEHRDEKKKFSLPHYYPCRLSSIQAAVGLGQLRKLPGVLSVRKETVNKYCDILRGKGLDLNSTGMEHTTLRFSLLINQRDEFAKRWERYFEIGKWFDSPVIGWSEDLERIGYSAGSCPKAEFVHRHIVNFPTYQKNRLIKRFLEKVISTINAGDVKKYEGN